MHLSKSEYLYKLKIASLNDELRRGFNRRAGIIVLTQNFTTLPEEDQQEIVTRVKQFEDFSEGNDPHNEHDFGAVEHDGKRAFFKIDYYDQDLLGGSSDPSDPEVTQRILTIMVPSDY